MTSCLPVLEVLISNPRQAQGISMTCPKSLIILSPGEIQVSSCQLALISNRGKAITSLTLGISDSTGLSLNHTPCSISSIFVLFLEKTCAYRVLHAGKLLFITQRATFGGGSRHVLCEHDQFLSRQLWGFLSIKDQEPERVSSSYNDCLPKMKNSAEFSSISDIVSD